MALLFQENKPISFCRLKSSFYNHESRSVQLENIDFSSFESVLIPVEIQGVWFLIHVNQGKRTLSVYDPIPHASTYYSEVLSYVKATVGAGQFYSHEIISPLPQKSRINDTGLYILKFSECILVNPQNLANGSINSHSLQNFRVEIKSKLSSWRSKEHPVEITVPSYFIQKCGKQAKERLAVELMDWRQPEHSSDSECSEVQSCNICKNTSRRIQLKVLTSKEISVLTVHFPELLADIQTVCG